MGALDLQAMALPFLACIVLSVIHVYLGIHVISRKVIFVDLALAQIAALGATYATLLGYDPYGDSLSVTLFSLAFTFVGAGAFAVARMRKEKVPQEAFIGIIYAAATAASILLLSKSATGGEELKHMLVGDLLLVRSSTVLHVAILYAAIGVFHIIFRKKFLAISLDPDAAEAAGIRIRFWDVLFYMSFGVVITRSVSVVGVLLVFSYLVVPAVIAHMWFATVSGRMIMGWIVALVASVLGILWSFHSDYPTGPAVVLMLTFCLIVSAVVYYLQHSRSKVQAAFQIAAMVAFVLVFIMGLSHFKRTTPIESTVQQSPVELLIGELSDDEEAHQLDAIQHLSEMRDNRIVPALSDLLQKTSSEQVVESTVEALGKQNDPRAITALQNASKKNFDAFLKLSIANAQLKVGDNQGFQTLIAVLESDEGALVKQQAFDTLQKTANQKFPYRPEKNMKENEAAVKEMHTWWETEGKHLAWNERAGIFE